MEQNIRAGRRKGEMKCWESEQSAKCNNQLITPALKSAGVFYVIRKIGASISQTTAYAKNIYTPAIDLCFTDSTVCTAETVRQTNAIDQMFH